MSNEFEECCPDMWEFKGGVMRFALPDREALRHTEEVNYFTRIANIAAGCEEEQDEENVHRAWMWYGRNCASDDCDCGRITLLEALERMNPGDRGGAVKMHAAEMRRLFEHFWSGQALLSGASRSIGEACSSCLIHGAGHVVETYENACMMAEEFGEALAAYAYELMVGEPRFSPVGEEEAP